jgi:glycosyltransferase involved in cell wall biosynthesis
LEHRNRAAAVVKIAYFSPMLPAKTGIATYSNYLVPALAKRCEVTVFAQSHCTWSSPEIPVYDFNADPYLIKSLPDFDQIIYHIGNNPHFHLDIYKVLLRFPGVVVLHDLVLYFLVAGQGRGGLIKEFCENYGPGKLDDLWKVFTESPGGDVLQYGNPARYPLTRRVLDRAHAIVVHNQTSATQLAEMGFAPKVHVIPLLNYEDQVMFARQTDSSALRSKLGLSEAEVVIGMFGFIGPTKRIDKVFRAVRTILDETPNLPVRILIVGEGAPLTDAIHSNELQDIVIETGFVPESKFLEFMNAVDLVANLRYPSMGESSASLVQAMSLGKPVIVTNHGSFADLPDNVVVKVSYGSEEILEIARALKLLIESREERERLGEAALRYVTDHCAPQKVADQYLNLLHVVEGQRHRDSEEIPSRWADSYLRERFGELIP